MKKIYFFPQKNLILSVPIILILGFIVGSLLDTTFLKPTILIATIIMIYATMVGFKINELASLNGFKVLFFSLFINFTMVPLIAFIIGKMFLSEYPIMFTGLALISLIPTSGMTISWTSIQKGNVPVAIKLTVFGLILGSLLTPFYLLLMVGSYVDINIIETFKTIGLVVFIPLVLGQITYKILLKKYTEQDFKKKIKQNFPPLSIWAMLYVIFVSTSMKAEMILTNIQLLGLALVILILFYGINYLINTILAVKYFSKEDGIVLVNGTVLRNLSIAIGIAATTFGSEAALLVTIAFIVQQQSIAYYSKLSSKKWFNINKN